MTARTLRSAVAVAIAVLVLGALLLGGWRRHRLREDTSRPVEAAAARALLIGQSARAYPQLMRIATGALSPRVQQQPEFIGVPPNTPIHRLPLAVAPLWPNTDVRLTVTSAVRTAWVAAGLKLFAEVFEPGSAASTTQTQALRSMVATADGSILYVAGGVNSVTWQHVHIVGGTATVSGVADLWSCVGQWQEGRGYVLDCPHGRSLVSETLDHSSGAWRTTAYALSFVPGNAP